MQNLQNMYLVRTGVSGPDMPYDLHPIIWSHVFEAERAERYRARELRFRFNGFIAPADRQELLQGLNEWFSTETPPDMRSGLQEQILQRLVPRLSAVFRALFQPDTEDLVNLTAHAWTQVVFHITSLRQEIGLAGRDEAFSRVGHAQLLACSADGLHHIRLQFTRLPVGGPYVSVNIQYVGPHRFRTFNDINYHQTRGGALEEFGGGPPAVGRPGNDAGVFEDWRRAHSTD